MMRPVRRYNGRPPVDPGRGRERVGDVAPVIIVIAIVVVFALLFGGLWIAGSR